MPPARTVMQRLLYARRSCFWYSLVLIAILLTITQLSDFCVDEYFTSWVPYCRFAVVSLNYRVVRS